MIASLSITEKGKGVWRICVRHTWIPHPLRFGNVLALDCTGGGDGLLAITAYRKIPFTLKGALDGAELVTELLQKLEHTLLNLSTTVHGNKLIDSQGLSREAETFIKQTRSTWLTLMAEMGESQQFVNALHGLSLLTGDRKIAKLDELKARYSGTQTGNLLKRLFGLSTRK